MSDASSIEKLVHNLALERGRDYWDRLQHQKSQDTRRGQLADAHLKRQLKYLSFTGIKPEDMEKEMEIDSQQMKTYLERMRPSLIGRPAQRSGDTKEAARLAGASLIPPYAGFLAPTDPNIVSPVDPSQIKIKDVVDGIGVGWWTATGGPFPPFADVVFAFTPHQSAYYSFSASLSFHGFYVLQADDDWYTSKDTSVHLKVSLDAFQFVDRGWKSFPDPISRESQNIDEFDSFDQTLNFTDAQEFREGEPVIITARIEVDANARGSGSHAEINFADGDANFVQPQGLWVNPAP
jgi:hypothetical protein